MLKERCIKSIFVILRSKLGAALLLLIASGACKLSKNREFEFSTNSLPSGSQKIHKKIIRRNRFHSFRGIAEKTAFENEKKYLDFLKSAVVPQDDWEKINGEIFPVYSLEELQGIYWANFLDIEGKKSNLYLEMDINHARFLQKRDDRLPGATTGQQNSRLYVEELFKQNVDSSDKAKLNSIQNTPSNPTHIRIAYSRFAPSKRMVDAVLLGRHIKDIGIKAEDFLLSRGHKTSALISATIGVECSMSSFLPGVQNPWESLSELMVPINMINIYFMVPSLQYRSNIRNLIRDQLQKFGPSSVFSEGNQGEGSNFHVSVGGAGGGYFGSKESYNFVPDRPIDPTIPSHDTFESIELSLRAYSILFPYESISRAGMRTHASDAYPLLDLKDGLESDFSVAVLTLFILGKTIETDGTELLHVRYAPTSIRTFPADWKVVDKAGVLLLFKYRDPIDVAKSMIIGTHKLMVDAFFKSGTNKQSKYMMPYEIRDQMRILKDLLNTMGLRYVVPDDVGDSVYEQILYRSTSDTFLFLGKHSGAKTLALKKL